MSTKPARPDKRMRVAMVAYTEYPWDPRVRSEAETLQEEGYIVHVIALRPKTGPSPLHLNGVHLWEVPLVARRGGMAQYLYQYAMFLLLSTVLLLRLHLKHPFDLVHVHSLPDFQVFCALPLKIWRVPVLLDLHEAMPELFIARFRLSKESFPFRLASIAERASCRFANRVITANDGIREVITSRGVPSGRVVTIYTAVEPAEALVDAETLRHRLGLPPGRLIVHAGGINKERDLETVIRAVAFISGYTQVYLVIAGDGEPAYVDSLKHLSRELGIENRVIFTGQLPREEATALMSMSEVGLVSLEKNPLTELAWPVRLVEYLGLRKPLVVSDLRFMRAILRDAALYYVPSDPISLSGVLREVILNPGLQKCLLERSERVTARFSKATAREKLGTVRVLLRLPTQREISTQSE